MAWNITSAGVGTSTILVGRKILTDSTHVKNVTSHHDRDTHTPLRLYEEIKVRERVKLT